MMVGGIAALMLQALHPLAMAGVDEHSDFRVDPLGRLRRTSAFVAAVTFGATPLVEQHIAMVRAIHTRVTGTAADGRAVLGQRSGAADLGAYRRACVFPVVVSAPFRPSPLLEP